MVVRLLCARYVATDRFLTRFLMYVQRVSVSGVVVMFPAFPTPAWCVLLQRYVARWGGGVVPEQQRLEERRKQTEEGQKAMEPGLRWTPAHDAWSFWGVLGVV
jgi:hypothetical protein